MASNPIPALLEQIDELLTASPSAEPATLARLERRMNELAGELHDGNREQKAKELAQVSRRISRAGAEIDRLRGTLSQLRAHATAVRATA